MRHYTLDLNDPKASPRLEPDTVRWAKWFGQAERRLATEQLGAVRIETFFTGVAEEDDEDEPRLFTTLCAGLEDLAVPLPDHLLPCGPGKALDIDDHNRVLGFVVTTRTHTEAHLAHVSAVQIVRAHYDALHAAKIAEEAQKATAKAAREPKPGERLVPATSAFLDGLDEIRVEGLATVQSEHETLVPGALNIDEFKKGPK